MEEVAAMIRDLYRQSSVGCCLHVQLDDGNLKDRFFDDDARQRCCPEHLPLFDALRKMSVTQRKKASRER